MKHHVLRTSTLALVAAMAWTLSGCQESTVPSIMDAPAPKIEPGPPVIPATKIPKTPPKTGGSPNVDMSNYSGTPE